MPVPGGVGYVVVPPDGGWGWVVVVATFLCNCVGDGIMYSFGIFIDALHSELQEPIGKLTRIGSFQSGFYYLSGPIVSAMVNKLGYRIVSVCGGIVAAAAYLGSSFGKDLATLTIVNGICAGIGLSMIFSSATICIGFYFERWRALASGLSTSGSAVGTLAIPPLLMKIMEAKGRPFTYRVMSGILLCTSLVSLLYRPLKPVRVYTSFDEAGRPMKRKAIDSVEEDEGEETSCWRNCCGRRLSNRHYPRTADVVSTEKMMVDEDVLYESSSDDEARDPDKPRSPEALKVARNKWGCRKCRRMHASRPMYRDDIFFAHSLMLLPEYRKQSAAIKPRPDTSKGRRGSLSYHMSVTRTATRSGKPPKRMREGCFHPIHRALVTLLDVRLLKSPAFLLVLVASFLTFGHFIPLFYIKDRAEARVDMDKDTAVLLLSTMGLTNVFGRIICGILPLSKRINIIVYLSVSLLTIGTATILSNLSFMLNVPMQFVYMAVYGIGGASIAALRPVLIVEQFGLEHLTNALGLTMLFQGMGVTGGVIVAGLLLDATGSFDVSYYMSGGCMIACGLLYLFVSPVRSWEKKRGILVT